MNNLEVSHTYLILGFIPSAFLPVLTTTIKLLKVIRPCLYIQIFDLNKHRRFENRNSIFYLFFIY